MRDRKPGGRRGTWTRLGVPLLVVALVAGASVRAFAASSGEDAGSYRTGAVTRASVQQQLTLTGSVQQVSQSSERFSSAGTLTSVDVSVGDQVQMGDELAQIDPTRLEAAVLRAEASLAQAEATLESDQSSSTSNPTASSTATGPAANTSEKPSPALTAAQKAVDAARRDVAAGLAASAAAMRAQQTACSTLSAGTPTATPTATPSPTGSTSAGESTSTGQGSASTSQLTDCINALGLAAESQRKTAADQNALDRALTAWADAIAKASDQPSSSGDSGAPRSSGDSAVSSSDSGQAETSSAARIASGEAAVRAAEAALATAEKDLAAATLTAGISGTVASVPFAIGGMASTSDAIVIVGAGAVDVTVAVPLATVKQIKVGGTAQVTADGATTSTEGVVRAISLLPSADNASSTPTYPVTVRVSAPSAALVSGASATVAIELSRVNNAVTVPNSAVTPVGTAGTSGVVLVWENGVATRTPVVLGAVGLTRTQVVSGLTVGQRVVLADLGQDLPTNQTGPTRGDVFEVGPGGKPGAGFRSRVDQAPR